ncbi:MAG: hypothetical protein ACI3YC_06945 [Alloprevotella sp.]
MAQNTALHEKSMQRSCFAKKNNLLLHRSKQKRAESFGPDRI